MSKQTVPMMPCFLLYYVIYYGHQVHMAMHIYIVFTVVSGQENLVASNNKNTSSVITGKEQGC